MISEDRERDDFGRMQKKERVRGKPTDAEETYREAVEEIDRDCKRNSEEENKRELKVKCINIFHSLKEDPQKESICPFQVPRVSSLLGSICLTGLAIACLGQPIMPFKHFHFGGSCCPSSCILPENEKAKVM